MKVVVDAWENADGTATMPMPRFTPATPPGVFDPEALIPSAAEVADVLREITVAAGRTVAVHARRITPRWICLTGLIAAYPAASTLQAAELWWDGGLAALTLALLIAAPCIAGLIVVRRRGQQRWVATNGRMAELRARRDPDRVAVNSVMIRYHDDELSVLRDEVENLRAVVTAAYRAAGIPEPLPRLAVVTPIRKEFRHA